MPAQKILVVESNPTRGRTLKFVLCELGQYEVVHATMIPEVFELVKYDDFDLIITNTSVQRENDGIKLAQVLLLRLLKGKPSSLMIATTQTDKKLVQAAQRLGVAGYLIYPFEPETLLKRVEAALSQRKGMSKEQLQKEMLVALKQILELPTISPVSKKLEALVQAEETSVEAISEVIEFDLSITAKVLKAANSPLFGLKHRIESVFDGVKLLGFERLESMVMAASTFEAIGRIKESPNFSRLAFWQHSIGVGAIAKVLANKVDLDPHLAFSAGILHDIGKVVLDGYFASYFSQALKKAAAEDIPILQAEKQVLPISHEGVGCYLATLWGLPQSLVEVVGDHNSLRLKKPKNAPLLWLVHVANAQCRQLQIGFSGDATSCAPSADVLDQLGLSHETLVRMTSQMKAEIKKSFSLLTLA